MGRCLGSATSPVFSYPVSAYSGSDIFEFDWACMLGVASNWPRRRRARLARGGLSALGLVRLARVLQRTDRGHDVTTPLPLHNQTVRVHISLGENGPKLVPSLSRACCPKPRWRIAGISEQMNGWYRARDEHGRDLVLSRGARHTRHMGGHTVHINLVIKH